MKIFKIGNEEITNKKVCSNCSSGTDPVLDLKGSTVLCQKCINLLFEKIDDECTYCGEAIDTNNSQTYASNNDDKFFCNKDCHDESYFGGIDQAMDTMKELGTCMEEAKNERE